MRRWQSRRGKKWMIGAVVCLLFLAGLFLSVRLFSLGLSAVSKKVSESGFSARTAAFIWKQWYPISDPSVKNIKEDIEAESGSGGWLVGFLLRQMPYYRMMQELEGPQNGQELDPAYRGYMESNKILEEYEYLVKGLSESAVLSSENNPLNAYENYRNGSEGKSTAGEDGASQQDGGKSSEGKADALYNQAGTLLADNSSAATTGTRYIEAQLADYDFLMKHFYTVHSTAAAGRDMMKAETFLSKDFSLKETSEAPQILIYHTHSQEEFADYGTNKDATIVGVGNYLTELLQKKGYNVIHDTSVYDLRDGKLDRSKAYTYALDGITGILQKYPSIQVVLDIHRDGVKEGTHLVSEVNGKQTASIMFFNGTSQTPAGPIEYLKNPYRTDNMAFSFQMKLCAEACYPGFTRKIYLKGLRYNMHLRPRSALVEVGAQTNTYEEAKNAMEPLSELLDMVLRPQ